MDGVACDSPVRRFTAKQNKENSPVDVNRLKTLLRKKVGDDAVASGSSASPKKAGTPRKAVKIKRGGTTLNLCSSCADHNKDLGEVKNDADVKKKRTTRKNAENQGQDANPANEQKGAVEKKTAAKKPRETKKKAGAPIENLDMPSTSGIVPSKGKATVTTDSGQAEGEARPKRQRKKSEKSVQENSTVEKEKKPSRAKKEVIKVKVAQPRKTSKKVPVDNEKAPFENMNVTDLTTSILHSEEAMQSSSGKSDDKQKTKKKNKELMVQFDLPSTSTNSLTNEDEISNNPAEPKKKGKNTDTTSKIPRLKKTTKKSPAESEKAPFESMDVTDLVNSTDQGEETTEKSHSSTKQKTKKKDNVWIAPNSSLTNARDNLINLPSSSNNENEVVDNSEDMFENSSVNRQNNKDPINFNSNIEAAELQTKEPEMTQKGTEDKSTSKKSKDISLTQANSSINSSIDTMLHNEVHHPFDEVLSDFNFDISDNPMPTQVMAGVSTGNQINISASTNLSRDDMIEGNSMNVSNEINVTIENSFGRNSTLTGNTDALNIIDNVPAHLSFQHDITFPREHLPNDTFDNISEGLANVTLRTKKCRKNNKNADAAQNISIDGVISFTPTNSNRALTNQASNEHDETFFYENQQPSQADNENLAAVKPEPAENHEGNASKNLPNLESSVSSNPQETSNLKKKSTKPAPKSADPHSKSKASKASEPADDHEGGSSKNLPNHESSGPSNPHETSNLKKKSAMPASKPHSKSKASKDSEGTEKKGKSSKKNESPHKASKDSSKKLVIPSPPKSKKKSKDDDTMCEKHKNTKKCDEKPARRPDKKNELSKQLKNDLKVAKALEDMSRRFSRVRIGTNIGTINELHIAMPLDSDSSDGSDYSDSSSECPTDCSCNQFSSESSGDKCKCWRCLRKREDASDSSEAESDEDDSSDESSTAESSSSEAEEIHRPTKKHAAKREKIVKPTFKEKLSKYCSKYDLRSNNTSRYDLRSHDH